MITEAQFCSITPIGRDSRRKAYPHFVEVFRMFNMDSLLRQVHFATQCFHESAGLTRVVENLNYSADGLAQTWPTRFALPGTKTPNDLAKKLARNPEAIANFVYADRGGNGPVISGDGWKYRGRGYIQTTFRFNYRDAFQLLVQRDRTTPNFELRPEALEEPKWAARAAGAFWYINSLNQYADKDDLFAVSGVVNAGSPKRRAHGLDDGDRRDLDTRADWLVLLKQAVGVE